MQSSIHCKKEPRHASRPPPLHPPIPRRRVRHVAASRLDDISVDTAEPGRSSRRNPRRRRHGGSAHDLNCRAVPHNLRRMTDKMISCQPSELDEPTDYRMAGIEVETSHRSTLRAAANHSPQRAVAGCLNSRLRDF